MMRRNALVPMMLVSLTLGLLSVPAAAQNPGGNGGGIPERVKQVEQKVEVLEEEMDTVQEGVDTQGEDIGELEADVVELEGEVEGLQGVVQDLLPITGEDVVDRSLEGTDIALGSITWQEIADTNRVVVAGYDSGLYGGDYSTIQNAINNTHSGPGDPPFADPLVIDIMPGRYIENIEIEARGWIHLRGAGKRMTRVRALAAGSPVFRITDCNPIILSNLTIEGGSVGIHMLFSNVLLIDCEIVDNNDQGVLAEYCSPTLLRNTIHANGTTGEPANGGIVLVDAGGRIADNDIHDNALGIAAFSSNPTVEGNRIRNHWVGIFGSNFGSNIRSNRITQFARAGILLQGSELGLGGPNIERNVIDGSGVGIEMDATRKAPKVIENRISAGNEGLLLVQTEGSCMVHRNVFEECGTAVRVDRSSAVIRMHGNTITESDDRGISFVQYSNQVSPLDGGGAALTHNCIYGSGSGVDLEVLDCVGTARVTVSHNLFEEGPDVDLGCVEGGLNSRINGAIFPPF